MIIKTIMRAYKTELAPTKEQEQMLIRFCDASRKVFNWGLEQKNLAKEENRKLSRFDMQKMYTIEKNNIIHFAPDFPRSSMEFALINLENAFKNFFRRIKEGKTGDEAGYPKFKSRYDKNQAFRYREWKARGNTILVTNVGYIKLKEKGYIPTDNIGNIFATISHKAGRWYISCTIEEEIVVSETTDQTIGVDWGIKTLATCSDGSTYQNPKVYMKYLRKIKRLDKELSRRKYNSKTHEKSQNWIKTKNKIAKLNAKIANMRKDTIHKLTHDLTKNKKPQTIVIEDLNVKGMMKNKKLAKSIADAAPGELSRQLNYKSNWYGNTVIEADRFFPSSKRCHVCGSIKKKLKLSERIYVCENCGAVIDRDFNGSKNLEQYPNIDRDSWDNHANKNGTAN